MSVFTVGWEYGSTTVRLEGGEEIVETMDRIAAQYPGVMRNAINQTATEARKRTIKKAKERYDLNTAGQRHLNDLKVKKRASAADLTAVLRISSMRNDLGYFKTRPATPRMGHAPKPEFFTGHVLKSEPMAALTGTGGLSKGFLVEFKNGHVGMVQRVIGAPSRSTRTEKGYPRWTSASGVIEKLQTMSSPSAAAMEHISFEEIRPDMQEILARKTRQQMEKLLAKKG